MKLLRRWHNAFLLHKYSKFFPELGLFVNKDGDIETVEGEVVKSLKRELVSSDHSPEFDVWCYNIVLVVGSSVIIARQVRKAPRFDRF
jgi:hypothetical protein